MRLDRDHAYLLDIQEAAELLVQFTSEQDQSAFLEDRKTQSAVIYQLLLMGEVVKRLSLDLRTRHPEIPWQLIAGMRDNLIHEYHNTDFDEVWRTVQRDIPELQRLLQPILATFGNNAD